MSVRDKSAAGGLPRASAAARVDSFATVTLLPNSGIQYLDLTLAPETLQFVYRRFLEETVTLAGGDTRVIHALEMDEGVLYHPATRQPLAPEATTFLSGSLALAPFIDQWVPLPYLRVLQGADATTGLDNGPSNWARAFIARPASGDAAAPFTVLLAFDTSIETRPGAAVGPALAPVVDDVTANRRFALSDRPEDLAWLLGEAWLDAWLDRLFRGRPGSEGDADRPQPCLQHEHLARYLTFLRVLRQGCALPMVRFVDTISPVASVAAIDVDLVLDVGNARTTGVLVDVAPQPAGRALARAVPIALRDLSQPGTVHRGPIESRIEFNRASHGDETLSRMSGRTSAFAWPSLVRIGPEAVRLSGAPAASEGSTGLVAPKRYLTDTDGSDQLWRFSRTGASLSYPMNPLVSGPMLSHMSETGEPLSRRETPLPPALRPRFSRSSLFGLFMVELVLHAAVGVAAPGAADELSANMGEAGGGAEGARAESAGTIAADRHRRLRRIVLTAPFGATEEERAALLERVEGAIDLVWTTMGWSQMPAGAPPRPEVAIGFDEAMGAQLVFLYNEVTQRLRTPAIEYVELMGKTRPEHGARPALRIASLDVGGASTDLTIVTYAGTERAGIAPSLSYTEKIPSGGDEALRAIVLGHLMPAMTAALTAAGVPGAEEFMHDALGVVASGDDPEDPLARRFYAQYAMPLALVVLTDYERLKTTARQDARWQTLGDLAARASGLSVALAVEIERLAGELGGERLDLAATPFLFDPTALSASIRGALGPTVAGACRVIEAFDCDQILLTGWSSRLVDVRDLAIEHLADRADRVTAMSTYDVGDWYPFARTSGRIGDPKSTAVVGALLASRASRPIEGVALELEDLSAQAQQRRLSGQQGPAVPPARTGAAARAPARLLSRIGAGAAALQAEATVIEQAPQGYPDGAASGLSARLAAARPEVPTPVVVAAKPRDAS